jgi:hypothetical protein
MIKPSWLGPEADGNMVANQAKKFVNALADAGLLRELSTPPDEGRVREIAKLICKSRSCEGISCCQWPANMGRLSGMCPAKRGGYDDAARDILAAIAALPAAPAVDGEVVEALRNVHKLISEAAMTGFNCHDGNWAERLFASQQMTHRILARLAPKQEGR